MGGDFLEQKENLYQIGSATYVVERMFSGDKTAQDVVIWNMRIPFALDLFPGYQRSRG